MTWRSMLKAKAQEYVVHHYSLGGHQSAEENLTNTQELIHGAMFIRDGVEEDVGSCSFALHYTELFLQGIMKNMASPALAGLVVDFFYTGPSGLANLFPEVVE